MFLKPEQWLWLYCTGKQGHLTDASSQNMLFNKMYFCLKLYGIWLRPNAAKCEMLRPKPMAKYLSQMLRPKASAFGHSLSGRLKKAQKFLKPER